jgi:hypothetical protein
MLGNAFAGRADFRTGNWLHQYVVTYDENVASKMGRTMVLMVQHVPPIVGCVAGFNSGSKYYSTYLSET